MGMVAGAVFALGASANPSHLPKEPPKGWILVEGPRVFTKANLFEHINGQAELFFKYGFQKCTFAVYEDRKNSENQIDVDIYDMGSVLQSFGIFSRLRSDDPPGGFGLDSCQDARSILFYKGKYFIMLYATTENPSVLNQLAMDIESKISDPSPPPREIGFFPKSGLRPGSVQFFSEGLLGHQFLPQGFQGTYLAGNKEFHLFMAIFKNEQAARKAFETYKNYLSTKGQLFNQIPAKFAPDAFRGEDPYQGELLIVQKGLYLLGGMGSQIEEKELTWLEEFVKNIP